MKKKLMAVFMAAGMVTGLLTGCGSQKPQAEASTAARAEESKGESRENTESPAAEEGEKLVLKLAMTTTNEMTGPTLEKFAGYVEENIPRVTIERYANGELYTNAEEMQAALSEGIIDITLEGDMAMSWASPEWISWTSIPFAFSSREQAVKFFTGDAGKEINEKLISGYNMRFFDNAIGARGGRMITANKKITKPEDLNKVKMRTPNVIGTVASWEALGATVITVSWGDLFNALQTGVVDAEENPYLELKSGGFYQVQKYIMETSHQIGPQVIWMNETTFQKFSPEEQDIIMEANKIAFDYYNSASEETDKTIREEFIKNGNIIVPAEEIDLEAFRQIIVDKVVNSDLSKEYKEGGWEYIQSLAE